MPKIEVKGRVLNYEDYGSGDVILFGHSFLWDRDMWRPQIDLLSKRYRCIVPDLWGHGDSSPIDGEVSLSSLGEDYIAFMDSLGIEKFSILGLSVGGMWGAHIAVKHNDRVKKLVLMDTYLGKEPFLNKLKYRLMIMMVEKASSVPPKLIEKVVPIFFSKNTIQNNNELVSYFKNKLANIKQENIATIVKLAKCIFWRENFLEQLKNIEAKTMVVVGSDDKARPPHESKKMANLIPGAKLEVINKAGHITTLEQAEEVNNVLEEFLND